MAGDAYKIFSLRFPYALAERLERAKALFGSGELSTGEAARRLLEQRLDQVDTDAEHRRTRQTLLDIRAKWHGGQELTRAEWTCLADYGYRAYSYAALGARSLVDRTLLAANLQAFGALLQLRQVHAPEACDPEADRYFLGNLGWHGSPDLATRLTDVLTTLGAAPDPNVGYFGSRNLYTTLRDDTWLAHVPLHAALAPYLEALLLVAIRGYWYEEQTPLRPEAPSDTSDFAFPLSSTHHARYTLAPRADAHQISVALELGQAPAFLMALDNYVEFTEFAELVTRARAADEPSGGLRLGGFDLMWDPQAAGARVYIITCGRFRFVLSAEEVMALDDLFREACAKPDVRAHLARLAFVYGRI